jgi:hypothetical protein
MDSPLHLVRRLWTSLFDRDLDSVQERRLLELLNEREADLYRLQPNVDKLHSIRGAVSVLNEISVGHDTDLVIAAALHDVGKTETGLNVGGRVVATIFQTFLPEKIMRQWCKQAGIRGKFGLYAFHSERGATLLREAGSSQIVVTWAESHHKTSAEVSMTEAVFNILKKADRL